jgi:hypothetical protein
MLSDTSADLPINLGANCAFGDSQVEVCLQSEPKLGRDAKVFAQSERGIGTDSTFPVHNGADASGRDNDVPGEPINADTHGLHEFFQKDLSGMNRLEPFLARHISSLIMIVNNLNVVGITASPEETDPPPVINPDTVLASGIAFKRFQAVAWRSQQIPRGSSTVKIQKFPPRDSLKGSEARHIQVGEQYFRFLGSKRADHLRPVYYAPRNSSSATRSHDDSGLVVGSARWFVKGARYPYWTKVQYTALPAL